MEYFKLSPWNFFHARGCCRQETVVGFVPCFLLSLDKLWPSRTSSRWRMPLPQLLLPWAPARSFSGCTVDGGSERSAGMMAWLSFYLLVSHICIRILRAELILTYLFTLVRQWSAARYCVHFLVQWIWKVSSTHTLSLSLSL